MIGTQTMKIKLFIFSLSFLFALVDANADINPKHADVPNGICQIHIIINGEHYRASGVLIRNTIITVAHIMHVNESGPREIFAIHCFKIGFISLTKGYQVFLHPSYNPKTHFHDLAVILLKSSYQTDVEFIFDENEFAAPADKPFLFWYGYGGIDFFRNPNAMPHERALGKIIARDELSRLLQDDQDVQDSQDLYDFLLKSLTTEDSADKTTFSVPGDSGAPLLFKDRNGHWFLTGILSKGNNDNHTIFLIINTYLDWIYSTLRNSNHEQSFCTASGDVWMVETELTTIEVPYFAKGNFCKINI